MFLNHVSGRFGSAGESADEGEVGSLHVEFPDLCFPGFGDVSFDAKRVSRDASAFFPSLGESVILSSSILCSSAEA
jgi:hypothetical protein